MASEPTTTPHHTEVTMTSDPMVTHSDVTLTKTPNVCTSPSHPATFASLPREIRDEIYRLALPHSWQMHFRPGLRLSRPSSCEILNPLASSSTYASEACKMLLKQNELRVGVEDLPLMLGEENISFLCEIDFLFSDVVSLNCIDVKSWLRVVLVDIKLMGSTDELISRVSLLVECPALQWVDVMIDHVWGSFWLRRRIGTLSCAFKALSEKLGRRLTFRIRSLILDNWSERCERFNGDLDQLETLVRDGDSKGEE
ncbi:hypothetical protein BDR22DRAFT_884281 [Usnea florida]